MAYNINKTDEVCVVGIGYDSSRDTSDVRITLGLCSDGQVGMTEEAWKQQLDKLVETKAWQEIIRITVEIQHREQNTDTQQYDSKNSQNKSSIQEMIKHMAVCMSQVTQKTVVYNTTVVFDYAMLHYCDMPCIVETLKDSMKCNELVVEYKVMYNIAYNREQNRVYRATDEAVADVNEICAQDGIQCIVLKQKKDKMGEHNIWAYTYRITSTSDAKKHAYELNCIHVSEIKVKYRTHEQHAQQKKLKTESCTVTTYGI